MQSSLIKSLFLLGIATLSMSLWAATPTTTPTTTPTISQKIHHFAVIGTDRTKVGEAIDITVEARDKDDKLIATYRGSIFFQASDYNATLPSQGKAIQFSEGDK